MFRKYLLALLFLAPGVQAACPSHFAAGDTNYIARLNLLIDCVVAGAGSPLTTKGDIWGYSTVNARLAVGSNNYILTADSAQTLGIGWKNAINGVTIGGTTPAAGYFTTLATSSGITVGGNINVGTWTIFGLGTQRFTNQAAASTPDSGETNVWADSTTKTLRAINDAGTLSTTVIADTGSSNNFLTAISAGGVISKAQPSVSNLSGFGTNVLIALAVNQGSTGSINPMTTAGDTIIGGASGVSTRLAAGATSGHVLTSNGAGAAPSWQASAGGFANPMTTGGDLIYGGASGVATRLANGTAGYLLQSNGTTSAPTWVVAPVASPSAAAGAYLVLITYAGGL